MFIVRTSKDQYLSDKSNLVNDKLNAKVFSNFKEADLQAYQVFCEVGYRSEVVAVKP